jgi:hypothetical protein
MEYDIPTHSVRFRLFDEAKDAPTPFKLAGWRGCALDHDRYDHARMPRALFDALITASASTKLLVERFAPDNDVPDVIASDWDTFRAHMYAPQNWCLEFTLFDENQRWAVLADADVIVVGIDPALAEKVDAHLNAQGSSLVDLTSADFPASDTDRQEWTDFLRAVVGRQDAIPVSRRVPLAQGDEVP